MLSSLLSALCRDSGGGERSISPPHCDALLYPGPYSDNLETVLYLGLREVSFCLIWEHLTLQWFRADH